MIEIIGPALSQWDTGRSVKITDIEAGYVHFANKGDAKAVIMELVDSQAKIPDYLFQTGKQLCVYAVKDGVTVESKVFYIQTRERPENYVYEDDQRNYIYELISKAETAIEGAYSAYENANHAVEAANTAIVSANVAVENANESADSAKQAAKNANEAADKANHAAKDAVKTVNGIGPDENGNVVVKGGNVDLTGYATEEWVREGYQPKGEYLTEHQDISGKLDASALPTAINTALAQAKTSGEFDGQPGKDGADGAPGEKGDKGDKGDPGANGVSATHSWNGTVLTVTSASGTSSADLKGAKGDKGADGYTPVKGKDYFTESEKQEIAEQAAELVPGNNVVVTYDSGTKIASHSASEVYALHQAGKNVILVSDAGSIYHIRECFSFYSVFTKNGIGASEIVAGEVYVEEVTLTGSTIEEKYCQVDKLPNPFPLTINGKTYDGSAPVSVNAGGGGSVAEGTVIVTYDQATMKSSHSSQEIAALIESGTCVLLKLSDLHEFYHPVLVHETKVLFSRAFIPADGRTADITQIGISDNDVTKSVIYPTGVPAPLTINGKTYDGTKPVNITIEGGSGGGTQSDWNASPGEPGHILNRTHWVEDGFVEVVAETTQKKDEDGFVYVQPNEEMVVGRAYVVTVDGEAYETKTYPFNLEGMTCVAFGNLEYLGGEATGEPFTGVFIPDMGVTLQVLNGKQETTFSIGYYGVVHKLDPKFLPNSVLLTTRQPLTEEQKAQARANIGAATVADVLAALPVYNGEVENA